jgi:hypothetical protein
MEQSNYGAMELLMRLDGARATALGDSTTAESGGCEE